MTTAGLARMNMILHNFPTANIVAGNTLTAPKFRDGRAAPHLRLRRRQPAVLRQDLDDWSQCRQRTCSNALQWGEPPRQAGRLRVPAAHHPLDEGRGKGRMRPAARRAVPRSCRSQDPRAACSLRLSQGNYRVCPPNLFYGTGIPACIVVLDKENAAGRKGVFMIDASKGFRKDGPKNRLREQDIHRIVDTFTRQVDVPRYARHGFD